VRVPYLTLNLLEDALDFNILLLLKLEVEVCNNSAPFLLFKIISDLS